MASATRLGPFPNWDAAFEAKFELSLATGSATDFLETLPHHPNLGCCLVECRFWKASINRVLDLNPKCWQLCRMHHLILDMFPSSVLETPRKRPCATLCPAVRRTPLYDSESCTLTVGWTLSRCIPSAVWQGHAKYGKPMHMSACMYIYIYIYDCLYLFLHSVFFLIGPSRLSFGNLPHSFRDERLSATYLRVYLRTLPYRGQFHYYRVTLRPIYGMVLPNPQLVEYDPACGRQDGNRSVS